MISFAVENYSFVTGRNPKFVMHFWTLAHFYLLLLTILGHVAIGPSISISIGAIYHSHDVDTSRVTR